MSWWPPFQINITGEWVGVFGTLAGVAIGYLLENIRNRKTEKKQHKRFMIGLRSEIDSKSMLIHNLIIEIIRRSLAVHYNKRKHKAKILLGGENAKYFIDEIEISRVEYNGSIQKYQEAMDKHFRHIIEFCSYLKPEDVLKINDLAIKIRTYSFDKFDNLSEYDEEQFKTFDYAKESDEKAHEAAKEFNQHIHQLSVLLGKEIDKL